MTLQAKISLNVTPVDKNRSLSLYLRTGWVCFKFREAGRFIARDSTHLLKEIELIDKLSCKGYWRQEKVSINNNLSYLKIKKQVLSDVRQFNHSSVCLIQLSKAWRQTHSKPNTFGLAVFTVATITIHGADSGSFRPKPLPRLSMLDCIPANFQRQSVMNAFNQKHVWRSVRVFWNKVRKWNLLYHYIEIPRH